MIFRAYQSILNVIETVYPYNLFTSRNLFCGFQKLYHRMVLWHQLEMTFFKVSKHFFSYQSLVFFANVW